MEVGSIQVNQHSVTLVHLVAEKSFVRISLLRPPDHSKRMALYSFALDLQMATMI